ncbi:MAG: hypothetical protein EAZ95_15340 [Bacteroidetes bacterium]|nr:MAG: hypothetical protein EAZ95_15340 [Bacteroidota bacterium]
MLYVIPLLTLIWVKMVFSMKALVLGHGIKQIIMVIHINLILPIIWLGQGLICVAIIFLTHKEKL